MSPQSSSKPAPSFECSPETARRSRNRGLANLLRMGHCAPSIMQATLDVFQLDARWLVKLMAGMPGGIGNTGGECGGVTAPIVLLGLRHAQDESIWGLPAVVYKGRRHLGRFAACQGSVFCRDILGDARIPLRCIGVVRRAPLLCAESSGSDCSTAISPAEQDAFRRLYDHWHEDDFHCAHSVFHHLQHTIRVSEELVNGTQGFMGGTVFAGMTCSALVAGVMALGLKLGEIENSHLRVLHMLTLMAVRGDAFADHVNRFNRTMNLGNQLAHWFAGEFGSTQCSAITRCDFSTVEGVGSYIEGGNIARCRVIAGSVAQRALSMIEAAA